MPIDPEEKKNKIRRFTFSWGGGGGGEVSRGTAVQ